MNLKINTTRLQELISRAVRGASNDKDKPMTCDIAISRKDGKLTVVTTDATNYLYLTEESEGEDFYIVVRTETFAKLISKMTSETTELEVTDSYLMVRGNGEYKLDLELDEDGTVVRLPDPVSKFEGEKIGTLKDTEVATILNSLKPSLLKTWEYPWFMAYYMGDVVVGTDTFVISSYTHSILADNPKLISVEMMDLLGLLVGDIDIYASADGNTLEFRADNGVVHGAQPNGIENYSIADIKAMVAEDFDCSCAIAKAPILNLLYRISLFVGVFDNDEVVLNFEEDGIEVSSKYATEKIAYVLPYTESANLKPFTCRLDIKTLTPQIKAQMGGTVTIEFGRPNAIKLIDGDVTSVVALITE